MLNAEFYNLLMDVSGAVWGALAAARARSSEPVPPAPPILQLRGGKAESPAWFLVQASEFAPEPLTVANVRVRDVYASERIVQALLELMASEGWLDRQDDDTYPLTEAGRAVLARSLERRYHWLSAVTVPVSELTQVEHWLSRLLDASLQSPTPPGTWCLAHSRRRALPAAAPLLARIHQYFDDFNAFRDDAHMAAWQPLGVSGHEWEAFALVCSEQARTAQQLFEQLHYRGYRRTEYATALDNLTQRGWLSLANDTAYVIDAGRAVREQIERDTDKYFYAPWTCLTDAEVAMTRTLLMQLRDRLHEMSA
jgi:hypothetical protein